MKHKHSITKYALANNYKLAYCLGKQYIKRINLRSFIVLSVEDNIPIVFITAIKSAIGDMIAIICDGNRVTQFFSKKH